MQNPISSEKLNDLAQRMASLGITEENLVEKFVRGSGSGGQKINKTSNCVFLKHLPSGVCIKCQMDRSRVRKNPGHRKNAPPETPAVQTIQTTVRGRQTHPIHQKITTTPARRRVNPYGHVPSPSDRACPPSPARNHP
jgi:protein subunit release factor B